MTSDAGQGEEGLKEKHAFPTTPEEAGHFHDNESATENGEQRDREDEVPGVNRSADATSSSPITNILRRRCSLLCSVHRH